MLVRALSARIASWRARYTRSRLSAASMSIRSMMMRPPMFRKRSWCTTSLTASRLVLRTVSSRSRFPDEASGVHVDGGEGFALIDDQVAAGLEPHFAAQVGVDLGFDLVVFEDRRRVGVPLDLGLGVGDEAIDEVTDLAVDGFRIDDHARRVAAGHVPDDPQRQRGLFVEHARGPGALALLAEGLPHGAQIVDVPPRGPPRGRPRPPSG